MKKQRQHRVTLGFWSSLYTKTLFQKNYKRYMKNVENFWRGKLDGEEEENSKTFWFPVEESQTVINGDRTRFNIFIYLLLFDFILLARSLRQILVELQCFWFFLDIDECSASPPVCDVNANCSNTRGSYICTCKAGYNGDGKTCGGRRK